MLLSNNEVLLGSKFLLFLNLVNILLSKVLGLPVTKPRDAIDSVAKGLSRINGFLPAKLKINNKNITNLVSKYYEGSKK